MSMYYFVGNNGLQNGPVPAETLKDNGVTPDTLVWCEGMAGWTKAADVAELAPLFAPPAPPMPPVPPVPPVVPEPDVQTNPYTQQNPYYQTNQYGQSSQYQQIPETCPDTYLVWAIITTLCCCWPFSIPAIVNATKVERLWAMGDKEGAVEKSNNAKKWCWVSAGVALGFWILYIIFYVCIFAAAL